MTSPAERYREAVVASEAICQGEIAAAHAAFTAAIDELIAGRPEAAGPVEMSEIAEAERGALADLQNKRDRDVAASERGHRQRVAASAPRFGIATDTRP